MNEMTRDISVPNDWDRSGLPGWCYHSPALLELEKQHFKRLVQSPVVEAALKKFVESTDVRPYLP